MTKRSRADSPLVSASLTLARHDGQTTWPLIWKYSPGSGPLHTAQADVGALATVPPNDARSKSGTAPVPGAAEPSSPIPTQGTGTRDQSRERSPVFNVQT